MTDASRSERTDHATHDLHVLAAAADRTADAATRLAADDQVNACWDCAELFADLRLISAGLGTLPRSLAVTRDFRISPERAAQLRPTGLLGVLRGLLGGGPALRPFASALTTLGIAGLVLTVALPGALNGIGGLAGGAASERTLVVAGDTKGPAPEAQGSGSGKSDDQASQPAGPDGLPVYPPASTTPVAIGGPTVSSPGPSAVPGSVDYGARQTQPTDTGAAQTPVPAAHDAAPNALGILAAISLGVLLLGTVLLLASRSRRPDPAG